MSANSDGFKDYVLDQLADLHGVKARAMFGGYGLYRGAVFFGIIHKGRLFFKTDDRTRDRYREQGMKPFRPNGMQTLKTYYEVPADVLEDSEQLTHWAQTSASLKQA